MKARSVIFAMTGALTTLCGANAALPHLQADLTYARNVPPPITRTEAAIVEVDLTASHKMMPLSGSQNYGFLDL